MLPFPALFLLGPLAGLLALARPAGFREWVSLGLVVLLAALSASASAGLRQDVTLAAGAIFTGIFLALLVWRPGAPFRLAVAAAMTTTAVVAGGCAWVGLGWEEVRAALDRQWQEGMTLLLSGAGVGAEQETAMREAIRLLAGIFPGVAFLGALAGGTLAAALAARLGRGPVVLAPGPFRRFRFNDHLIWGALGSLALVMLPLPAPWSNLITNVLVVWIGLYVARGAAIWLARSQRWPTPVLVALFLSAVLLLPYALGALLILGLADTWIEIRRELPPPGGIPQ
ncbi:MAG TPA: DUF2232 domain-containing protein [Gemmatimonadales bacterium]